MINRIARKLNLVCIVALVFAYVLIAYNARSPVPIIASVVLVPLGFAQYAYGQQSGSRTVMVAIGLNALLASYAALSAWEGFQLGTDTAVYRGWLTILLLLLPSVSNVITLVPRALSLSEARAE